MTPPAADLHILDPLPIQVSRPLVLLRLGYRQASQVPGKTSRLLDEVIARAAPLLSPRAIGALFDVAYGADGGVVIGGEVRSASRSLQERLEGCRRALLFAATIGDALENWIGALGESGDMTRSLLADAYASSAAIALGISVEADAGRTFAGLGLTPTKRYAPGYGDWELSSQEPLLRLLQSERIGIRLTEDFLMLPAKSISGVIGGR